MSVVGILSYGASNLFNVARAVEHLGYTYRLVSTAEELALVDKLILPGVGAFRVAMDILDGQGLTLALKSFAAQGKPMLGICLGMQLLFDKSYEFGETAGLELIPGTIEEIPEYGVGEIKHNVPHVGWSELNIYNKTDYISEELKSESSVYFVHSFMANPSSRDVLISSAFYNGIEIPAIVRQGNIIGVQFHPEKSGEIGLNIIDKFLCLDF